MTDVSTDEFLSATKCVLERFHIDKFRETQQDAILNLIKEKDVLVSTCIPLTCLKFELTNQDSVRGKNFTVLTSM